MTGQTLLFVACFPWCCLVKKWKLKAICHELFGREEIETDGLGINSPELLSHNTILSSFPILPNRWRMVKYTEDYSSMRRIRWTWHFPRLYVLHGMVKYRNYPQYIYGGVVYGSLPCQICYGTHRLLRRWQVWRQRWRRREGVALLLVGWKESVTHRHPMPQLNVKWAVNGRRVGDNFENSILIRLIIWREALVPLSSRR